MNEIKKNKYKIIIIQHSATLIYSEPAGVLAFQSIGISPKNPHVFYIEIITPLTNCETAFNVSESDKHMRQTLLTQHIIMNANPCH